MLIAVIDVRGQTHYLDPKLIRHIAAVQRHDMVRTVVMTGDGRCFDSIDDVNRRANGDRDRRAIGDQGLMRAYAVAGWRRA